MNATESFLVVDYPHPAIVKNLLGLSLLVTATQQKQEQRLAIALVQAIERGHVAAAPGLQQVGVFNGLG
jgi:hypothetical protein